MGHLNIIIAQGGGGEKSRILNAPIFKSSLRGRGSPGEEVGRRLRGGVPERGGGVEASN